MDANYTLPNWKLIDYTLETIRKNQEGFDMSFYLSGSVYAPECKTTMCFAGWVLTLTGHDLQWKKVEGFSRIVLDDQASSYDNSFIGRAAAQELNIDETSAENIFYACHINNNVDVLEQHILHVLGPRPKEY